MSIERCSLQRVSWMAGSMQKRQRFMRRQWKNPIARKGRDAVDSDSAIVVAVVERSLYCARRTGDVRRWSQARGPGRAGATGPCRFHAKKLSDERLPMPMCLPYKLIGTSPPRQVSVTVKLGMLASNKPAVATSVACRNACEKLPALRQDVRDRRDLTHQTNGEGGLAAIGWVWSETGPCTPAFKESKNSHSRGLSSSRSRR